MRQPSFDSVQEMLRHFTSTPPAPQPRPSRSRHPRAPRRLHPPPACAAWPGGAQPLYAWLHAAGCTPLRRAAAARWGRRQRRGARGGRRREALAGGRRRACSRGRRRTNATRRVFSGLPAVRSCPAFSGLCSQPLAEAPPQLPQRCRAHLHEAGPHDCITSWRLTGGIGSASRGYEAAFPNSPRFQDHPPELVLTTVNSSTSDGEPISQGHSYECSCFALIAHSSS
jgi:hypothetical protein